AAGDAVGQPDGVTACSQKNRDLPAVAAGSRSLDHVPAVDVKLCAPLRKERNEVAPGSGRIEDSAPRCDEWIVAGVHFVAKARDREGRVESVLARNSVTPNGPIKTLGPRDRDGVAGRDVPPSRQSRRPVGGG